MPSPSQAPPSGLKMSTAYPASVKASQGWVSSLHQNPTGQPVVVEVVGLAMTSATRLRRSALTGLGSCRLMERSSVGVRAVSGAVYP